MRTCTKCTKRKAITAFALHRSDLGQRSWWCKSCQRVYKQLHYRKNKAKYKMKAKLAAEAMRALLAEIKTDKPCLDCGVVYPPYVMEFDHVRGKKVVNVGSAVSIQAIKAEIPKCELVCSNCHKIRTHARRGVRPKVEDATLSKLRYWFESNTPYHRGFRAPV